METLYYIYQYSKKNNLNLSQNQIKTKYNFIRNRDFKLFNSKLNSDIAKILFDDDAVIIKLNVVSVILFENDILIFSSLPNIEDEFIKYFKNLQYNHEYPFSIWAFEMILIFISNYIDNYLETCSHKFSLYNINDFKSTQYVDILTFQHSLLTVQNNYKEIHESLVEIFEEDDDYKQLLFSKSNYLEDLNKIMEVYTNQIKEDIKNLDRFIKQVEMFIDLASLKLSETRNKIARKSIHINFIGLLFNIGTFTCCFFGTNLNSGLEEIQYLLWGLFFFNSLLMIICYFCLGKYYKIKRCSCKNNN